MDFSSGSQKIVWDLATFNPFPLVCFCAPGLIVRSSTMGCFRDATDCRESARFMHAGCLLLQVSS